jgi:nitrite reductase/ring-hydroxylating ferredoxin subunit
VNDRPGYARHRVGAVEDFVVGQIQVREIADRSVGVVRTADRFYAILNVCPHELAPVCEGTLSGTMLPCRPGEMRYGLEDRILRCPWHGYEFDLGNDGRAAYSSFHGRVRLFPVLVEDGEVFVVVRARSAATALASDA